MDSVLVVLLIDISVLLLNIFLPAPVVDGYVKGGDGKKLKYRLNAFRIFLLVVAAFIGGAALNLYDPAYFHDHIFEITATNFSIGLLLSVAFYLAGPFKWNHVCAPKVLLSGREKWNPILRFFYDFFFGFELNPRWKIFPLFDFKMFLYLIGTVWIELSILSAAAAHLKLNNGALAPSMFLYVFEMTWFLVDYVYHEHVHLYTYDLFDENIGFKLVWGCFVVYSHFYGSAALYLVSPEVATSIPTSVLTLSAVLFFTGYPLTRGANMQKYYFKINPNEKKCKIFMGHLTLEQESIDGKLLASGFWKLSRHINYLGEIFLASAMALATGFNSIVPWLYPIYYLLILSTRERDDHVRCQHKYGETWTKYCKKVPNRIIPYLY